MHDETYRKHLFKSRKICSSLAYNLISKRHWNNWTENKKNKKKPFSQYVLMQVSPACTSSQSLPLLLLLHLPFEMLIGFCLLIFLQFPHVTLLIFLCLIQIALERERESECERERELSQFVTYRIPPEAIHGS